MSDASVHIAGWESAGVIDRETAERLRAAEAETGSHRTPGSGETDAAVQPRSAAAAMFGPGVTISEVFAFLGGGFLLAAWSSFISRATGPSGQPEAVAGIMALLAAAVLGGLGLRLRRGSERGSRAAGVAFILASSYVGVAAITFASSASVAFPAAGVLASGAALAVALGLRSIHPSILTQVGVLSWMTALAASALAWVQVTLFPEHLSDTTGLPTTSGLDPIVLALASAAWWLAMAVFVALIGLREARRAARDGDAAAARRAAVSRFWAGLTAVIGLAMAITSSGDLGAAGYGRVLQPWIGDLALLALSAVLIERAFRRDASSFIYTAALGLIVALTDFNVSYLSGSSEVALVIEGLILLGVGFVADRLRRRVGRHGAEPPGEQAALAEAGHPA
jgi:hypothetical protein